MASNNDEKNAPEDANSLKEKGNDCVKNGNYKEAALLYTHAIKIEPKNQILYSNRSLAYLKLQQYQLALEDANKTIDLEPKWAKGYFRKGEVHFALNALDDAFMSYKLALMLLPEDTSIKDALERVNILRTTEECRQKSVLEAKKKLPWVAACIGLIIGVILTILDFTMTEKPTLTNPLLQVIFAQVIAGAFWLMAYALISLQSNNETSAPIPVEVEEETNIEETVPERTSNRYTKAQARHRYKKGKMNGFFSRYTTDPVT